MESMSGAHRGAVGIIGRAPSALRQRRRARDDADSECAAAGNAGHAPRPVTLTSLRHLRRFSPTRPGWITQLPLLLIPLCKQQTKIAQGEISNIS